MPAHASTASRTTACSRAAAPSSTTSRCRGCCTRASCAARSRARRSSGIDTSAALALPGVRFVFTAADLNPGVREQWHTTIGKEMPETPRPPLAEGEVRFVGDPVALVVAESRYLAEDAAELVEVDYEPLPAVVDYTEAEHARSARPREPRLQRHRSADDGAGLGARRGIRRRRPRRERDDLPAGLRRRFRWKGAASWSTTRRRRAT